mmetsp:Transcript_114/g.395  ORF Transcript_114/g.395 Transcript_114/m.395 type:complete len:206 (-) Transcript_114:2523-3140(-)
MLSHRPSEAMITRAAQPGGTHTRGDTEGVASNPRSASLRHLSPRLRPRLRPYRRPFFETWTPMASSRACSAGLTRRWSVVSETQGQAVSSPPQLSCELAAAAAAKACTHACESASPPSPSLCCCCCRPSLPASLRLGRSEKMRGLVRGMRSAAESPTLADCRKRPPRPLPPLGPGTASSPSSSRHTSRQVAVQPSSQPRLASSDR